MTVADRLRAEVELSGALAEYAGEWVGVRDHQVVIHGRTLHEVLELAEDVEIDAVFEVPDEVGAAFF